MMFAPGAALAVAAILFSFDSGLPTRAKDSAGLFQDRAAYQDAVLESRTEGKPEPTDHLDSEEKARSQFSRLTSVLGAVALAIFSLSLDRIPKPILKKIVSITDRPSRILQDLHSGHVGDYVAWLMFGVMIFGVLLWFILP